MLIPQTAPKQIQLKEINGWYESTVKAESWRPRAEEDAEFLANVQWTDEQKKQMKDNGMAVLTMNQIHRDYYLQLGRQIMSRIDPGVKPRGNSDWRTARALTDVIKFLLAENNWDYEQTEAVKDQLIVRGWMKVCYQREDLTKEPISIRHVPWREIRIDSNSRRMDLDDCNFVFHERWSKLEDIQAQYPDVAENLAAMVGDPSKPTMDAPATRHEPSGGDPYGAAIARGEASKEMYISKDRKCVRVVECWYRTTLTGWQMKYADGKVVKFDPMNPQHVADRENPRNVLTFGPYRQIMYVLFSGDTILGQGASPYTHGYFPYVPMWGHIANVSKRTEDICPWEPYGIIRIAKDPQRFINSTHTKIRHILNTRQVVMGPSAADRSEVEQNASDPGGIIQLNDDNARFEFVDQLGQAGHLTNLLDRGRNYFEAASGINEASRGIGPEQSGTALRTRQYGSELNNTLFPDNQRRCVLQIGRMLVSMIQQSMTEERVVRITEDLEDRVIAINVNDPARAAELEAEGVQDIYGSVTQGMYDVEITDIEASQSRREMDNELMVNIIQNMDPGVQLEVMDLLVENTELKNREEFIRRIKVVQARRSGLVPGGMPGPGVPGALPEAPPATAGMPPGAMPMVPPAPPIPA